MIIKDLLAGIGLFCIVGFLVIVIVGIIDDYKLKHSMVCKTCGSTYDWYYHYCPICVNKLERRKK